MLKEQLQDELQERKEKWWTWHKANPHVWQKFEEYTFQSTLVVRSIANGRSSIGLDGTLK
jgi:hypothetical protein